MFVGKQGQQHMKTPRAGALTRGLELVADEGEQLAEYVAVGHGPGQEAVVYAGGPQEQVRAWWEVRSLQETGRPSENGSKDTDLEQCVRTRGFRLEVDGRSTMSQQRALVAK